MSIWSNLQKRERVMVSVGGFFVLLMLSYLFIMEPIRKNMQQMQESVPRMRAEVEWMQNASVKAKQLASSQTEISPESPLKIIDQTARRFKIASRIKRVDPGEDGKIKVWFEGLSYTDFVKFLRETGVAQQILVSNLTVERLEKPGLVDARVTFKTGTK